MIRPYGDLHAGLLRFVQSEPVLGAPMSGTDVDGERLGVTLVHLAYLAPDPLVALLGLEEASRGCSRETGDAVLPEVDERRVVGVQVVMERERADHSRDDRIFELDIVVEVEAELLERHPCFDRQVGQLVAKRHPDLAHALEDEKPDEMIRGMVDGKLVRRLQMLK